VFLMSHARVDLPKGIVRIPIPHIRSLKEYSEFMIWDLPIYRGLFENHILTVQHDGYIVNPAAWTDEFLQYDYIGAPWYNGCVGNGGFSLRSQKLLYALTQVKVFDPHPEDWRIGINYREELEGHGVKYAPVSLAHKFSIENKPYVDSFGFHGAYTQGTLK